MKGTKYQHKAKMEFFGLLKKIVVLFSIVVYNCGMSIYLCYLLILSLTSTWTYFLVRGFDYAFIYRDLANMWNGIFTPLMILVFFVGSAAIIGYYFIKPFDDVVTKIRKRNEIPTAEEKAKALSGYRKVVAILFSINFFGFFVGQMIIGIIRSRSNVGYDSTIHTVATTIHSLAAGAMAAGIESLSFNEILAPYRRLLQVHTVESFEKQKAVRFASSTFTLFVTSMLYACANMSVVPFGLLFQLQTGAVTNALNTYLRETCIAAAFAFIPPFVMMRVVLNGFSKRIDTNIARVLDIANDGDLTSRLNLAMLDDYGKLSGSINVLIKQLSLMFKDLKSDTDVVAETSDTLSEVTNSAQNALSDMISTFKSIDSDSKARNQLISDADKDVDDLIHDVEVVKKHIMEQSSAIQQNSASITQMSSNIGSVAEMTIKAEEVSVALSDSSSKGSSAINTAITSIEQIQSMSHEVQDIVKVIQKIASQTNLLSMNAAIEAAHAGAMGQGFAVVADEVRSLASSSAKSARDIQEYIKEMVEKIDGGVEAIAIAGRSFREIAENVEQNNALIKTISSAMEEQKIGASETLNTTTDMVNAIQAIKDLTEHESVRAASVRKMMKDVVTSSEAAVQLVNEGVQASEVMGSAIEQVVDSVESNRRAVSSMNDAVKKFKV